jgi:hypothetical protein
METRRKLWEETIRTRLCSNISSKEISKSIPIPSLRTDNQQQDVWTNNPTVEIRNLLTNNDLSWERFIHDIFILRLFVTVGVLECSIGTLHAYKKKKLSGFQDVSLMSYLISIFAISFLSSSALFGTALLAQSMFLM